MNNKITLYSFYLEIRYRFVYWFFSFCFTFLICYLYSFELIFLLVQPFYVPKHFIFTDLAEALSTTIYVCLITTIHFVIPFLFYQSWSFFIPGFFNQERNKVTTYILSIFFFIFLEGILIFFLLLPEIFAFLFSFEIKKELLTIQLEARIQSYIHFTFYLYLSILFSFQLPFFFFFLLKYKMVTARDLSYSRKYSYFFSLLFAAFISPPDILYQLTIAFFFIILYEIGVWLGFTYEKKRSLSDLSK